MSSDGMRAISERNRPGGLLDRSSYQTRERERRGEMTSDHRAISARNARSPMPRRKWESSLAQTWLVLAEMTMDR